MNKVKTLEDELIVAKSQLPTSSIDKLSSILSPKKPFGDKYGLGLTNVLLLQKPHLSTNGKINFVPPTSVESSSPKIFDKGRM